MDLNIDWVRSLRTLAVAALLVIALLGAVLGSIGLTSPVWNWACDRGAHESALAPPTPTGLTLPLLLVPRPA
jgi:hypothetical protein